MVNLIAAPVGGVWLAGALPYVVKVDPALRVPLPDGRVLSARLWLPDDPDLGPVPAVVEYAPFRHRDFTYPRDSVIHPWFAGHGYASIRLEPAGSGDSEGLPMDEYMAAEQDDCVCALAWIAEQPWCSGQTGMFGMSWGAFSALQVAARRPPSLQAIIPVHGTDDRYSDDIHYKGGCMLTSNLAWGVLYQTYMMRPPDPVLAGSTGGRAGYRGCNRHRTSFRPGLVTTAGTNTGSMVRFVTPMKTSRRQPMSCAAGPTATRMPRSG